MKPLKLLFLLSTISYQLSAFAELTATVYPGYTLGANERPTTAVLNLMARPTVTVSGTLGGTNVGLAAHTVSGAMLMTSVVDDDTVEFFDNGGVTAIRVKAYNIGTNVLGSNVAGLGLGGGNGFALSNKVDGVAITITNDVVTLATNLSPTYLGVASNAVVVGSSTNRGNAVDLTVFARMLATNQYASAETTLVQGSVLINAAHNLGVTPSQVTAAIICKTAEWGFSVGDELNIASLGGMENTGSFERGKLFAIGGNSTNVFAVQHATMFLTAANKTNGANSQLTFANWKLKLYARP